MDETTRMQIRHLLKRFGVQADETISAFLASNPDVGPLQLRITLTDLTDYGDAAPQAPLQLEVEGAVGEKTAD